MANPPGRRRLRTRFLKSVPTVWKQSVPLCAEVGEYLAVAREAFDGRWFIGAMTNSTQREVKLSLDFLPEGEYLATVFCDGPVSDEDANDYSEDGITVSNESTLNVSMSREGGYVAVIKKK